MTTEDKVRAVAEQLVQLWLCGDGTIDSCVALLTDFAAEQQRLVSNRTRVGEDGGRDAMRRIIGITMLILLAVSVTGFFGTIMVLVSGWKMTLAWLGGSFGLWLWMLIAIRLITRPAPRVKGEGK